MLPIGYFSPAYRQNLHFTIFACRHGRRHGHRRESHAREVPDGAARASYSTQLSSARACISDVGSGL
jgi:hypothetical protein